MQKYQTKPTCYECVNIAVKDGYCAGHWQFLFAGMNNRQRMTEKKKLREFRRQRETADVQAS